MTQQNFQPFSDQFTLKPNTPLFTPPAKLYQRIKRQWTMDHGPWKMGNRQLKLKKEFGLLRKLRKCFEEVSDTFEGSMGKLAKKNN
jgi:hypothetical protein